MTGVGAGVRRPRICSLPKFRKPVNLLPPPLRSQAGLRGVGRGPAGGRASDAAIVALLVRGGLVLATVESPPSASASASASSGSPGALGSTQHLRKLTSTMARH